MFTIENNAISPADPRPAPWLPLPQGRVHLVVCLDYFMNVNDFLDEMRPVLARPHHFVWNQPARDLTKPGVALWTLHRGVDEMRAELRYRGDDGVEAQLLKNGELRSARLLPSRALAVQWAGELHGWLLADGWTKLAARQRQRSCANVERSLTPQCPGNVRKSGAGDRT
jgi:hypothetical protein